MRELAASTGSADPRSERCKRPRTIEIDRVSSAEVFDRFELIRQIEALRASGPDTIDERPEPDPDLPAEDRLRFKVLRDLLEDPRGSRRPVIVGTREMEENVCALALEAPNFESFLDIVRSSVALSRVTKTPLRIHPTLLVGPPGVGKTRLLKRLASALHTRMTLVDMPAVESWQFTGQHSAFRGARAGLVAESLLAGTCAPVVLLDEVDKPSSVSRDYSQSPHAVFHSLLEEETAAAFKDQYLQVSFRCQHIIWVASANDLSRIPSSIISRLVVIDIPPPNEAQKHTLIGRIFAEEMLRFDAHFELASSTARDAAGIFITMTPRLTRRAIQLSLAFAADDDRQSVELTDVQRACDRLSGPKGRSIGFLRGQQEA